MSARPTTAGLLLALALLTGATAADAAPRRAVHPRAAVDSRIRTVDYDPQRVVRIAGAPRTATQVVFAADETVQHVALGDSAGWEVAVDGNVLFLKPRAAASPANLIVTTARGGDRRSYIFELTAAAGGARAAAYVLRFRYPPPAAVAAAGAVEAALQSQLVALKLERGALAGPRNLSWREQGPAALAPSEVSDNGRFTVLRFPGGQSLPALYAVDAAGTERLVRFAVRGEFVVIEGAFPGLRLRRGRSVLCLWNDGYRATPATTGTLTAAPDVVRTELGARP